MSDSPQLPPSARDFLIYQRVVIEGVSTRSAAEEAGVSQTRVRQLVIRVTQWLALALPAGTELSEAAQLRVGQHIAADRLEHFYCQANRAWLETTQPKYASLCLRIITAQSKVPALPGTIEALAMDAVIGPLPDSGGQTFPTASEEDAAGRDARDHALAPLDVARAASSAPESRAADKHVGCTDAPPDRDCSPAVPRAAASARTTPPDSAVIRPVPEPCGKTAPPHRAARGEFFAPAHSAAIGSNEVPVTELRITPHTLSLSAPQVLSRKDRRRLRRSSAGLRHNSK